ncbi:hypothetical protein EV1_036960 [Malus domestica]
MAVTFFGLNSAAGLKKLDDYLLDRSYIIGSQASKDDLTVHAALSKPPSPEFVNVSRWYNHIAALFFCCFWRRIWSETKAADDVDLFGEEFVDVDLEETKGEKKVAEERVAAFVKAYTEKEEYGKSSVLLDVKPWDDETDMKLLEEAVRSVDMEGLHWGTSKLVDVGYGIKKLQIMLTIVDDLVSVGTLIEEHLTAEPINQHVQSCDIVAFNKI